MLPIRVLHDFADRLDRLGIRYMLTGSLAMFHYSNYRMTADIDIVMELERKSGEMLARDIEPDYYVPHGSMRRAIESKRIFNVLHQETSFKVDCVMQKETPFHQNAFERRKKVDFHGKDIFIITAEDLVISKLWWASDSRSEKQLSDVRNLIRNELDLAYIELWTKKLSVDDLLELCRKGI